MHSGQEGERVGRFREGLELGPALARLAAEVRSVDPDGDPIGLIAEAGTIQARKCRTKFEQLTGIEYEATGIATVIPKEDLTENLGPGIPEVVREWLCAGEREKELRFVVCTMQGFQVATVPLN